LSDASAYVKPNVIFALPAWVLFLAGAVNLPADVLDKIADAIMLPPPLPSFVKNLSQSQLTPLTAPGAGFLTLPNLRKGKLWSVLTTHTT
jgi:hypothetical protein